MWWAPLAMQGIQSAGAAMSAPDNFPSNITTPTLDGSGWNVNFGSGSIDSARSQSAGGGQMNIDQWLPYALLAVGLVAVLRLTRK